MRRCLALFLALAACAPVEEPPVDPGTPVDPLYLPDTSDIDFPAAYAEAFALALSVRTAPVWRGHVDALALATPGCPDLWAGAPDDALEVDTDAPGVSWADHCAAGTVDFGGAAYWETDVSVTGDATTAEGQITSAARTLISDAVVGQAGETRFELDGEATDALTRTVAPDYDRYTWSSLVQGTVTGTNVLADTPTPGGYRADVYLYVEGGDSARLEARGNVYLYEDRVAERFDSLAADLSYVGVGGPSDCTREPTGWLSLRDSDAYWYDLVFLPGNADDVDTGLDPACDGCGTLYVRGVESGEVCVDLGAAWDGRLAPPETSEFVWSIHG